MLIEYLLNAHKQKIKDVLADYYNIKINQVKCGHGGTLDPFATGVLG
jgi:tRNA U55 pseudouridine synthase TruB